jgi:hypothetical protein
MTWLGWLPRHRGGTADTPAGGASADGVAESCCGAGVEDERDSSNSLRDGGMGVELV